MVANPRDESLGAPDAPPADSAQLIVRGLYARTAELGIKNKILSLHGELYDVSIQALSSKDLADKLTAVLAADLSCELAVILMYDEGERQARTLAISQSDRFAAAAQEARVDLSGSVLSVPESAPLAACIATQRFAGADSLAAVWGSRVPQEAEAAFRESAHARSVMLYPLVVGGRVIGVLVLALNRSRDQLSDLEHTMFDGAVNVIAVALEKTLLYEALQKANQELQDLSRFKSQLLSLASHQIKAPLAALKGYLSLMAEGGYGEIPAPLMKPLAAMQHSANGLVELVTSFLDLRRIDEGKMEYKLERTDLAALVRDVAEELRPLATEKGLALEADGLGEPCWVQADAQKLRQVAQNLIDNAIKYTPAGSVAVLLRREGGVASCSVSDTGLGMAPELLPRLFDEFTRDQRVEHVIRGTGLGLYIAKRMIEAHGGTVTAASDGEGKGSRFTFSIPLAS